MRVSFCGIHTRIHTYTHIYKHTSVSFLASLIIISGDFAEPDFDKSRLSPRNPQEIMANAHAILPSGSSEEYLEEDCNSVSITQHPRAWRAAISVIRESDQPILLETLAALESGLSACPYFAAMRRCACERIRLRYLRSDAFLPARLIARCGTREKSRKARAQMTPKIHSYAYAYFQFRVRHALCWCIGN
jgi:hypothetical protein